MSRSIRVYLAAFALVLAGTFTLAVPAAQAAPNICRPNLGCGCNIATVNAHASRLGPEECL
jgi:hypothetical protein